MMRCSPQNCWHRIFAQSSWIALSSPQSHQGQVVATDTQNLWPWSCHTTICWDSEFLIWDLSPQLWTSSSIYLSLSQHKYRVWICSCSFRRSKFVILVGGIHVRWLLSMRCDELWRYSKDTWFCWRRSRLCCQPDRQRRASCCSYVRWPLVPLLVLCCGILAGFQAVWFVHCWSGIAMAQARTGCWKRCLHQCLWLPWHHHQAYFRIVWRDRSRHNLLTWLRYLQGLVESTE